MKTVHQIDREQILNEVKQTIMPAFVGLNVRIYLFGSWARKEERTSSDIDVAIESDEEIPYFLFVQTRDALEESLIPYHVDLVYLQEASESLKDEVRREGILWKD